MEASWKTQFPVSLSLQRPVVQSAVVSASDWSAEFNSPAIGWKHTADGVTAPRWPAESQVNTNTHKNKQIKAFLMYYSQLNHKTPNKIFPAVTLGLQHGHFGAMTSLPLSLGYRVGPVNTFLQPTKNWTASISLSPADKPPDHCCDLSEFAFNRKRSE